MKTQNAHLGSFLIGLLAGSLVLLLLALSQPLRTETQTSLLLRNDTRQFPLTISRSVSKTWSQVRSDVNLNWLKIVRDIKQTSHKDFAGFVSSIQPCVWMGRIDLQIMHLAELMHFHIGTLNPPSCKA